MCHWEFLLGLDCLDGDGNRRLAMMYGVANIKSGRSPSTSGPFARSRIAAVS